MSLLTLVAIVVLFIYPPIIVLYLIAGLIFWIWISNQDKKAKAIRKAEYDKKWNPEAVFERRLQYAIRFEGKDWTRKVTLEIGATQIIRNTYAGIIKTSTGKEVWRCQHGHSKNGPKKMSRYSIDPSIKSARQCAQKELDKNYANLLSLAKNQKTGIRHKRSRMENEFYDPIHETLKSFNYECAYCGITGLTKESTHRDHVVPLHVGGGNSSVNMLPICAKCNLAKGTKSVFQFLLEIESRNQGLPYWVLNSPTWQEFRYRRS